MDATSNRRKSTDDARSDRMGQSVNQAEAVWASEAQRRLAEVLHVAVLDGKPMSWVVETFSSGNRNELVKES